MSDIQQQGKPSNTTDAGTQADQALTLAQIRNSIRPADPDTLLHVGSGVYRATWMRGSSPIKDEIRLKGMSHIEIIVPLQFSEIPDGSMFLCFRIACEVESGQDVSKP